MICPFADLHYVDPKRRGLECLAASHKVYCDADGPPAGCPFLSSRVWVSVIDEIERIIATPDPKPRAAKLGFVDRVAMHEYDRALKAARLAFPDDADEGEWVPPPQTKKILYTREEWYGHLLAVAGWSP